MKKKLLALVLVLALVVSLAVALAACDPKDGGDGIDLKLGLICLHDENSTYDKNFIDAAQAACDALGAELVITRNIPEGAECYDAAADLVDQGCDVIFADSFGHETYMIQAAKEFPDVMFAHATGTKAHTEKLPNYFNAFASVYDARYLAGVVAGHKLNEMKAAGKQGTPKLGYVGAFTYAEVISGYTSFYLGAKSVCPDVVMDVQFTGTWYGTTEESEAASGAESDNGEEIKVEVVRNRHFGYGVRPSGRTSRGIRGMRLVGDDRIVSLIVITPDGKDRHYAIILTAKGKGKKMVLEELTLRNRGGQGIMVMPSRAGEKNGPVIGATRVEDGDEFLIITDQGTLIRSPVDESLRPMSRMAVGVILMRPGDNENIIALETIPCEVAEASREAQNARRQEKKDREAMELMVSGGSAVTQNGAEKTEDAAQDSDPGYDVDQGAEGTATLADNEEK